ncbi:MAG: ester cyclase [Candidatus Aminicenantes bacterium]|nr:ester cyclase [Candidatus Aminicenantes bacterium]
MKKSLFRSTLIIPLALLFCFALSCQQQGEDASNEEELRGIILRVVEEAWNQGKMEVLDEHFAPEYVYHHSPSPDIEGLEAYKQYIIDTRNSYPDFKLTIEEMIIKGDISVVRGTFSGTNTGELPDLGIPATGKQVTFNWCLVSHHMNGKTKEEWNYMDQLGLMQQLGFTLTPPELQEKK